MILKIIFTDVCINILKLIICKHIFSLLLLTSDVPLQIGNCTPTRLGVHVPSLGTPSLGLRVRFRLGFKFQYVTSKCSAA